jgi:hypothetical protein
MLPSIDSQNRSELSYHRVLVRIRPNLHASRLCILDQPRPTTALDACKRRVEFLLERVEAAVAVVDGLAECACRGLAAALAGGRQVLPEQRVVEVAAAVEVDEGLQGDLCGNVLLLLGFGDLLAEVVERGYVRVVVVLVVQFHDLARDGGLEGAIVVWEGLLAVAISMKYRVWAYMGGRAVWPFHEQMWCLQDQLGKRWERWSLRRSAERMCGGVWCS